MRRTFQSPFGLAMAVSALLLSPGMVATVCAADVNGLSFFESKVRPLLIERCYECHGEKKQKGGLRLDSRAGWQKGGENGAVIVPGEPATSRLITAVRYTDKDLQMPPKHPLKPEEIAVLELWVKIGAPDPREGTVVAVRTGIDFVEGRKQWAFQPVTDPQPPVVSSKDRWSRGEIDRFILQNLQRAGLQPSPAADRRTLIRRATFDLTGLPPTEAEVDSFLKDRSPDAFEKVVDRLLASPHYGEHWARHWLDVARYSDSKGYVYAREEKFFVHAWPYRDWVVRSLNGDMPYDRFLKLQLAADQLVPAGSPDLAAMGFLTLGRRFLGVTHDIIDDRIDVVMRGMQGLTVACARCHDHKFDPVTTKDYYALYGVFQSCAEKLVPAPLGSAQPDAAFEKELAVREEKLRTTMAKRREEQSVRVREQVTGHLLAQFELEKYPEETFTQILGPADINPIFVRRWQAYLIDAEKRRDPVFAAWHAFAKLKPTEFAARSGDVTQGLRVLPAAQLNPLVAAAFATNAPASMREVAERYGAVLTDADRRWKERRKADPSAASLADADAEALRRVLYGPDSPCFVPDEHIVNNEWFFPTSIGEELWKLQGEVDRWLVQSAAAPAHSTILVDRAVPSTPRVFKRGNPLTKGDSVPRRFLQIMAGDEPRGFEKGSGRMELADAIASKDNPLTARVMVNRIWMQHFGRGLVATTSDFGKRAEPPSHPELLDWLSRRFMDEGWSVKKLHRRILLSATWQQSSSGPTGNSALRKVQDKDPDNRLLWRMNTHRLGFEEMRDAWLSATGELDAAMGGRPMDIFAANNRRRTLYALVDREKLPSVFSTFDFANPDLSIPQRAETVVPQQALFGLNHPFLADRARALAGRIAGAAEADDAGRVRRLYSFLYQRAPTKTELSTALAFVKAGSEPSALETPREQSLAWQYGYGEMDEATGRLKSFTVLPHFNGSAWQGGEKWPDAKLGWVQVTATGGHPGNDRKHAAVRRWIAPQSGNYTITSTLIHEPAQGDGIRAFISHGGRGLLKSATVHQSTEVMNLESVALNKGDTLDFVVDIRDVLNSDQFLWSPRVSAAANATAPKIVSWDANRDFTGNPKRLLDVWQQLAQALMLSNEFLFLD